MTTIRLSDLLAEDTDGQSSCSPMCARSRFLDEKSEALARLTDTWISFRVELRYLMDKYEETVGDDFDRQSMAIMRDEIERFHDVLATRVLPLGNQ
jgi:hypothetical protein